jgi:O-acetyl-ADP-ribose deacetylase (regulator of RNase III)
MITYVTGDATLPQGDGRKIIAHVCNDAGAWGAGFVLALSERDLRPEQEYHHWWMGDFGDDVDFQLGEIQLVAYDTFNQQNTYVCNMIAQTMGWTFGIPLRLWALRRCLTRLNQQAKFGMASVHMPRIGCGLAGGKWEDVEPIIRSTLTDTNVTVYDLPTDQS